MTNTRPEDMNIELSIATIRVQLRKALPLDADFNSFVLDYFPDIYYRLSDGMDRLAKENLLLSIAQHATLQNCLARYRDRDVFSGLTLTQSQASVPNQRPVARLSQLQFFASAGGLLFILATCWLNYRYPRPAQPAHGAPEHAQPGPASAIMLPSSPLKMSESLSQPAYPPPASRTTVVPVDEKPKTKKPNVAREKTLPRGSLSTNDLANTQNQASSL